MQEVVRWRYHAVGTVLMGVVLATFQTVFRDGADTSFVVAACVLYFVIMVGLDIVRSRVEEDA